MTHRFAMRPLAAMLSSLRSEAVRRRPWWRDGASNGRVPAHGGAASGVQDGGWRSGLRRSAKGLLRPVVGVLPLLIVALWHVAASAQGAAAPATATPQEAATVLELQVLQSQQALVSLRKLKTELGTIELLLHPRTNRYYIAVTSRTGQVRRVVRSDNERAAQLGFESFRRLAGQGEAGRPALLGETLTEAEAGAAAAAGGAAGNAAGSVAGGAAGSASRNAVSSSAASMLPIGAARAQGEANGATAAATSDARSGERGAGAAAVAGAMLPAGGGRGGAAGTVSVSGETSGRTVMQTPGAAGMQVQSRAQAAAPVVSASTASITSPALMGRIPADAGDADASMTEPPSTSAVSPMQPPPRSALMDEVLRLQNAGRLTSMRRADNGSFSAHLFFQVDAARYFVVLAQGKDLWRVTQAQDSAQALRLYEDLAAQSAALAADELRRLELKAQTDAAERELRQAQAQARQMAEEVEADRRYRALIQAQEKRSRADVSALQQQQRELQEQLMAEQRRVMELRRQLDPAAGGMAAGGTAAGVSGAATRRGAGQQECRIVRPGQPVHPSERDLPVCGLERNYRGQ